MGRDSGLQSLTPQYSSVKVHCRYLLPTPKQLAQSKLQMYQVTSLILHPEGVAVLDWASPLTQYRLSGRQFYRLKDPTNSIKVLKEKLASHSMEEAQNPPGASRRVTSEPLRKKNPITVGPAQRDKAPHSRPACTSPVQNYRSCNNRCYTTGLGILYPLCTKPTSMMKCG